MSSCRRMGLQAWPKISSCFSKQEKFWANWALVRKVIPETLFQVTCGPYETFKDSNVQDVGVVPWAIYVLLKPLYRSLKTEQLLTVSKEIQSNSCWDKSEPRTVLCTDTHRECIAICSRKVSCWYHTYSGTGEQEGSNTVHTMTV